MTEARQSTDPSAAGAARPWTCPACEVETASAYCGACGERRIEPRDLTVVALLGQAVESVTNADGRIFRSFSALLAKPGALTLAYLRGERRRYLAPVQLFLLVNVMFFFVQALLGFQSLSNRLGSHLDDQLYSGWVRPLAERELAERGITQAEYAPVFDAAVTVNAKALAILMVPMFALLAWLLSPRSGRPAVAHVVFALHFEAFLLLALCVLFPLLGIPAAISLALFGLPEAYTDQIMTLMLNLLCAWYAHVAFGRVYGGPFWARAIKAVVFALLLVSVIRVYRLVVFFVTFYTA